MRRDPVPTPSLILSRREAQLAFAQVRALLTPSPILNLTPSHLTDHHGTGLGPP